MYLMHFKLLLVPAAIQLHVLVVTAGVPGNPASQRDKHPSQGLRDGTLRIQGSAKI